MWNFITEGIKENLEKAAENLQNPDVVTALQDEQAEKINHIARKVSENVRHATTPSSDLFEPIRHGGAVAGEEYRHFTTSHGLDPQKTAALSAAIAAGAGAVHLVRKLRKAKHK
jgi:hypothetical protein